MSREMKKTGVTWIGDIPKEWRVAHARAAFSRKNSKAKQEDPVILSLARSGVKIRDISNNDGQLAESYYDYNPVEPGDLLLNPMDLVSGANCSISEVSGVISPAYINLRSNKGYDPLYYDFYFKTQYWSKAFFAHGKGVSFDNRWTLSANDILRYYIPVPPEEEQHKIAKFLKDKCSKIETSIDEITQSIEECQSLKQSIVYGVLSNGLGDQCEKKNTGVFWLAKMPSDWDFIRVSKIFNIGRGRVIAKTELKDNAEYPVYSSQTKNDGVLGYIDTYDFEKDQLTWTTDGANAGTVFLRRGKHNCTNVCGTLTPRNDKYNLEYLKYALEFGAIYHKRADINGYKIMNNEMAAIKIPIPKSRREQDDIAEYLNNKISIIESIVRKKEQLVEELENYKRSIIYEYVTGKKEVPEL